MACLRTTTRSLLFTILVGALAVGLLGCGSDQSGKGVDVVEPRLVKTPNGERSFTGTLVNERSRSLSIAQIEVALYGDNGSVVENLRIEVKDVPAEDSVDFREKIDSDRPFSQAQVKSILTP